MHCDGTKGALLRTQSCPALPISRGGQMAPDIAANVLPGEVMVRALAFIALFVLAGCIGPQKQNTAETITHEVYAFPNSYQTQETFEADARLCEAPQNADLYARCMVDRHYLVYEDGNVYYKDYKHPIPAQYCDRWAPPCFERRADGGLALTLPSGSVRPETVSPATLSPAQLPEQSSSSQATAPDLEKQREASPESTAPMPLANPPSENSGASLTVAEFRAKIEQHQQLILFFAHPTVSMMGDPYIEPPIKNTDQDVIVDHLYWGGGEGCPDGKGETVLRFAVSGKSRFGVTADPESCGEHPAFSVLRNIKTASLATAAILVASRFRMTRIAMALLNQFITVEDCLIYMIRYT